MILLKLILVKDILSDVPLVANSYWLNFTQSTRRLVSGNMYLRNSRGHLSGRHYSLSVSLYINVVAAVRELHLIWHVVLNSFHWFADRFHEAWARDPSLLLNELGKLWYIEVATWAIGITLELSLEIWVRPISWYIYEVFPTLTIWQNW